MKSEMSEDLKTFADFGRLLFSYMERHGVRIPYDLPLEAQRTFNAEAKERFGLTYRFKKPDDWPTPPLDSDKYDLPF